MTADGPVYRHDLERLLGGVKTESDDLRLRRVITRAALVVVVPWTLVSLFMVAVGQFGAIWLDRPTGLVPWILHGLTFALVGLVLVTIFSGRIRGFLTNLKATGEEGANDAIMVEADPEELQGFREKHLQLIFGRQYILIFVLLHVYAWILGPIFSDFSEFRFIGHTIWTATVNEIYLFAVAAFIWLVISWSLTAYRVGRLPLVLNIYDPLGGLKPFANVCLLLTMFVSIAVILSIPNAILRGDALGYAQLAFGNVLILLVFAIPILRVGRAVQERKRVIRERVHSVLQSAEIGGDQERLARGFDALLKLQLVQQVKDYPVNLRILVNVVTLVAAPIAINILSAILGSPLGLP